jgi:hypothetical protein
MRRLITILFLFPLFCNATTYYVSASGSDGNNGTSTGTPWQTVSKVNSISFNAGDSIKFNCGDVFAGRLNCGRSGSAGNLIVYTSYGTGAQPIITGYITLSTWTNNGGGIYAAAAPGIQAYAHNLIMDGKLQTIAREPNTGFIPFTPVSTTSITVPSLTGTPDHTGDSLIVKSSRYTLDHSKVVSQSTSSLTISAVTYSIPEGIGMFWFNSSKWLDTLGEWIVNSTTDSIYVYFGGGGPGSYTVKVSVIDSLVYATGSYFKLKNLHITGGNMYNIVNAFGSGNNVIDSCTIDYAYTGADLRAQHDTVTNSYVFDCLNNGLMGPTNNVAKYVYIANDTIRRIGLLPGMGKTGPGNYEAVSIPADGANFYKLYIDSVGYHGIYTSADSFIVEKCHVNRFCITLADGGGIYTWDATQVAYAKRRRIDSCLVENGVGNTQGIVYSAGASAMGIYTDGKSNLLDIYGNTVINNPGMGLFHHGTNVLDSANKIYGNGVAQILAAQYPGGSTITGIVIKNNTFASPDTSAALVFFYTPSTNITTMGTLDSNYYASTNGISMFHTQGNGGAVVSRTLSDWRSFMSADANSTYQTGTLLLSYNTLFSNKTVYLSGEYKDMPGNIYIQLLPTISPLSGVVLFQLSTGLIPTNPGKRYIIN